MLSELPKLADKAFILGFFLPTLLFVLAGAGICYDQPWAKTLLAAASQKDGWDSLAFFVLAVWVLAVLLMMVNQIELQILEGYTWPLSKIAFLRKGERERFERESKPFQQLNNEWKAEGDNFPEDKKRKWEKLRQELVKKFPVDPGDHLPTRFGNAVRAFEVYSKQIYGADSIPLWLHLSTVVPADFQTSLNDARSRVNCAVNICFFAAVLAVVAVVRLVWGFEWHTLFVAQQPWVAVAAYFNCMTGISLAEAAAAVGICRLSYLFSIELVYPWGDLVKAAFDCYLPDLAKKLGFELAETAQRRKEFWIAVSEQAIYWRRIKAEDWKPPEKQAAAAAHPGLMNAIVNFIDSVTGEK